MSMEPTGLADSYPATVFAITSLADEIRADRACHELLKRFAVDLATGGLDPGEAGALAHGADYFLREFLIGERRENLLQLPPGRIRQFAGNWYIIRNLEPNLAELCKILEGLVAFYRYLAEQGLVSAAMADQVLAESADLPWFQARIDAFWAITGDGYQAWVQGCPLADPN